MSLRPRTLASQTVEPINGPCQRGISIGAGNETDFVRRVFLRFTSTLRARARGKRNATQAARSWNFDP